MSKESDFKEETERLSAEYGRAVKVGGEEPHVLCFGCQKETCGGTCSDAQMV